MNQQVSIFSHIPVDIGLIGIISTYRLAAPEMLRAPEPAFPAIRISHLEGETPHHFEEPADTGMSSMHYFGLAVSFILQKNTFGAIFFMDSFDLISNNGSSFIPGDPDVAAFTPILRIPFSVGVPVYPLQQIKNPVRGLDTLLIGGGMWRNGNFQGRRKRLTPRFQLPGIKYLRLVGLPSKKALRRALERAIMKGGKGDDRTGQDNRSS